MMVKVNGIEQEIVMQTCVRCCQDSTVPGIVFDQKGECNYCVLHDQLCKLFPSGQKGAIILERLFAKIKQQGAGKKYDCVVGISGGRDSTYLLWNAVKRWNLRPLAVHFNDGFDNPTAGENMLRAVELLNVDLITITSDWREAKDLKIDLLKASTPDLNLGTDIGIGASLYSTAHRFGISNILIGQSFRTEGIKPLSWAYFDGDYLRNVHKEFGTQPLKDWMADDAGFNLGAKELLYYSVMKGIKTFTPFYYMDYIRKDGQRIIEEELGWVYPGAHYYDDLYHSLIKYVHRVKFNIDMNMNSDAALVRTGQMERELALSRAHQIYAIEDPDVIRLCIKRLGISREEFDAYLALPAKTFKDYTTSYNLYKGMKYPIFLLSKLNIIPKITYYKYFTIGV
jgi:hypothetical protein